MASSEEVEIKFLVKDKRQLLHNLRRAGFREITKPMHEFNTLYDLPGFPLRKEGALLRLRKYGDHWLLTHKAKSQGGRYKKRVELETEVADGRKMDAILRALGYKPAFRYEKYRAEWSDSKGHVVIDETPIGDISEIEGPARWIDQTARKLGIRGEDYITQSYAELFFNWKRRTGSLAEEMTFGALGKRPRKRR